MKRDERHHLKENELAHRPWPSAQEFVGPRAKAIGCHRGRRRGGRGAGGRLRPDAPALAVARAGTAGRGDGGARTRAWCRPPPPGAEGDAPAAAQFGATGTFSTEAAKLNAALPKLKAAADAYPGQRRPASPRATTWPARSPRSAGTTKRSPRSTTCRSAPAPTRCYGRMARLGKADAQARAGQLDAAIAVVEDDGRRRMRPTCRWTPS